MTGRIGRFVKIYNAGADVGFQVALERSTSTGDWCEMSGTNKHYKPSALNLQTCSADRMCTFVVAFKKEGPVAGVEYWCGSFGLDAVVCLNIRKYHRHNSKFFSIAPTRCQDSGRETESPQKKL